MDIGGSQYEVRDSFFGDSKIVSENGKTVGRIEKDFYGQVHAPFEVLTRKALTPSAEELERNPRSRSAKLRAAVKL